MVYSIEQLRKLSDDQLIRDHDKKARDTVVGTQYYMDELDRRSRTRHENVMLKLTIVSAITSIVAVVISIIAIYLNSQQG